MVDKSNNNQNSVQSNDGNKSIDKSGGSSTGKSNKKLIALVVGGCVAFLVLAVIVVVGVLNLAVALKERNTGGDETSAPVVNASDNGVAVTNPGETVIVPASSEVPAGNSDVNESTSSDKVNSGEASDNATNADPDVTKEATQATTTKRPAADVSVLPELTKTGDNLISDKKDNEYIALISKDYNVAPELLVAVYAVPDKGNNFVLEFNGTKDDSGKVVRSPATLSKVYQIDADKNVSIATGKVSGNVGVSYAEGMLAFYMVKNVIMPQNPDYFTGIEK